MEHTGRSSSWVSTTFHRFRVLRRWPCLAGCLAAIRAIFPRCPILGATWSPKTAPHGESKTRSIFGTRRFFCRFWPSFIDFVPCTQRRARQGALLQSVLFFLGVPYSGPLGHRERPRSENLKHVQYSALVDFCRFWPILHRFRFLHPASCSRAWREASLPIFPSCRTLRATLARETATREACKTRSIFGTRRFPSKSRLKKLRSLLLGHLNLNVVADRPKQAGWHGIFVTENHHACGMGWPSFLTKHVIFGQNRQNTPVRDLQLGHLKKNVIRLLEKLPVADCSLVSTVAVPRKFFLRRSMENGDFSRKRPDTWCRSTSVPRTGWPRDPMGHDASP